MKIKRTSVGNLIMLLILPLVSFLHLACSTDTIGAGKAKKAGMPKEEETGKVKIKEKDKAIARIKDFRLSRISFGGPHSAVIENDITDQILRCGSDVIPDLLAYLPNAKYDEAVCILYCLTELKAKEPKQLVIDLREDVRRCRRFPDPHDLTLEAQIARYLEAIR